jgi:hypothetical protein
VFISVAVEVTRPGEGVLLLSYPVQPESSPYKGISPIFVREAAEAQYVGYDEIPAQIAPRLMSVRAFDARHYIVAADVTPGANWAKWPKGCFRITKSHISMSTMRAGDVTSGAWTGHSRQPNGGDILRHCALVRRLPSVAALSNNSRDRREVPNPKCGSWADENFDRQEGGRIVLGFGCWSKRQSKGGFLVQESSSRL